MILRSKLQMQQHKMEIKIHQFIAIRIHLSHFSLEFCDATVSGTSKKLSFRINA